jgi:hypothetical protein
MELENTHEILNSHFEGSDMTDFEKYSLAIQIQRNQILKIGLGVDTGDDRPNSIDYVSAELADIKDILESIREKL